MKGEESNLISGTFLVVLVTLIATCFLKNSKNLYHLSLKTFRYEDIKALIDGFLAKMYELTNEEFNKTKPQDREKMGLID